MTKRRSNLKKFAESEIFFGNRGKSETGECIIASGGWTPLTIWTDLLQQMEQTHRNKTTAQNYR